MFGARSSEVATFLLPKGAVWPLLEAAVTNIGGTIKTNASAQGELAAHISPSIWSYGEAVTIKVTAHGAEATTVSVESRCRMPLTLFDWGKNTSNVRRILQHVRNAQDAATRSADASNR